MIPALFALWALAAPMGYIIGDVFCHKNNVSPDTAKMACIACAALTPMAAMLAVLLIVQTETEGNQ